MYKILACDDEKDIVSALRIYLTSDGYQVFEAYSGAQALEVLEKEDIHLVLLDVMMPQMDGLTALARVRQVSNVPVILLTAKSEDTDKILGLNVGADDYVPKAFSPRELLARVRAVLRRAQPVQAERKEPEEDGVVRVRGLWMDRKSMKARMDGVPMDLTALEFRILFGMAAHPGRVFTRENLLELAVGREFSRYDRSVDMHISTLRRKLGDDPHNPAYLKTIRGMGYTLLPEEA